MIQEFSVSELKDLLYKISVGRRREACIAVNKVMLQRNLFIGKTLFKKMSQMDHMDLHHIEPVLEELHRELDPGFDSESMFLYLSFSTTT